MNIPWSKLLSIGKIAAAVISGPAGAIATAVITGAEAVEANMAGLAGPDKKQAVLNIVDPTLQALEIGLGKDLVNNDAVDKAISTLNDAYVAFRNAQTAVEAAIASAKATPAPVPTSGS